MPSGPVRSTPIRPPLAASSSRAIVRPEPEPGRPPRGRIRGARRVGPVEALEDVGDVVGRDARAVVGHADADDAPVAAGGDRDDPADRAVDQRVGDHVADGAGEVARIRPGDRAGATSTSRLGRPVAPRTVEGQGDVRDRGRQVDRRGPGLERRRLGPREVVDVGHHAAERRRRRACGLETGGVGRDDAVDHRLELGFEDGRRRRQIVGDVAGRPPAEHLRALEPVGHRVERLGQLGRFQVVATGRPGARVAGLESSSRRGDVAQRTRQPAGDRGRDSSTITSTLTSPATARVALNTGRKPRSPARAGMSASSVATSGRRARSGSSRSRRRRSGPVAERGQRRAVGRDDPDLATERVGEARHERLGADQPGRARQAVGEGLRRRRPAAAAAGRSAPSGSWC